MEQNEIKYVAEAIKNIIEGKYKIKDMKIRKAKKYGYLYFPLADAGKKVKVFIYEDSGTDISGGGQTDIPDELLPESKDLV